MKKLVAILTAVCACAQSGIDRPQLGQMLDAGGGLWSVYGVPGSFTVKSALARGVLSTACSRLLCIAKTDSAILIGGAATQAPRGPALIALDGLDAWMYFPVTRQLARWQGGALTAVDPGVSAGGEILSLQPDLSLAVRRADGVWIVSSTGAILDSLPPDTGPVLLIPGATIYATSAALVLRRSGGAELRFPASGISSLLAMADGFVEARAGAIAYALRTDSGNEHLFQLPQPASGAIETLPRR